MKRYKVLVAYEVYAEDENGAKREYLTMTDRWLRFEGVSEMPMPTPFSAPEFSHEQDYYDEEGLPLV